MECLPVWLTARHPGAQPAFRIPDRLGIVGRRDGLVDARSPGERCGGCKKPGFVLHLRQHHPNFPIGSGGDGTLQKPRRKIGRAIAVRVQQEEYATVFPRPLCREADGTFKLPGSHDLVAGQTDRLG